MSQLAIKGHATRGKKVIKILEMLGGYNMKNWIGDDDFSMYFINEDGNIICSSIDYSIMKVFTLEEFLEKFPYKVGDKVYNIIHNENQTITNLAWNFQENEVCYQTNNNEYVYVNYLQPYKEETMEEKADTSMAPILESEDYSGRRFGYKIHKCYEFDSIKGNEIIIKPIKPKYPKTYEECCEVLNAHISNVTRPIGWKENLISNFQELIICRDAYLKIAGDEYQLGKPWIPDWTNSYQKKWIINFYQGEINLTTGPNAHFVLAFPTEEMRDIFYENFKTLIEHCKEFL